MPPKVDPKPEKFVIDNLRRRELDPPREVSQPLVEISAWRDGLGRSFSGTLQTQSTTSSESRILQHHADYLSGQLHESVCLRLSGRHRSNQGDPDGGGTSEVG